MCKFYRVSKLVSKLYPTLRMGMMSLSFLCLAELKRALCSVVEKVLAATKRCC